VIQARPESLQSNSAVRWASSRVQSVRLFFRMKLLGKASDTPETPSVLGVVLAYVLFHGLSWSTTDCRVAALMGCGGWIRKKETGGAEGNGWAGSAIVMRKRMGGGTPPQPSPRFPPHTQPGVSPSATKHHLWHAVQGLCEQNTCWGPVWLGDVPSEQGERNERMTGAKGHSFLSAESGKRGTFSSALFT